MTQSNNQPTLIKDIMTSLVTSVTLNDKIYNVLKMAKEKNITGFPVIDIDRKVIGVVSTLDLITEAAVGKIHLKLGELPLVIKVDKAVIRLSPETPVKEAIQTLIKKRIGRIIVTDCDNKLCGIVSRKDLINFYINVYKLGTDSNYF